MPVHVKIAINEQVIERLHIARMEKLEGEDRRYEYRVVTGKLAHHEIRYEDGIIFFHKYSDGLSVCVERALAAVRNAAPPD